MSRSASASNPFVSGGGGGSTASPRREPTPLPTELDDGASARSADHEPHERPLSRSESSRSASSKGGVRRADSFGGEKFSEKSSEYGRGAYASSPTTVSRNPFTNYAGTFAPNPSFVRLLRFLLYGLASLSALATAGVGIAVVQYYNSRRAIAPSWGSLIALIIFGIVTPGFFFIPFLFTPRMFRYGTTLGIVNQVRVELLNLFALVVIWVSGALAMANDLRGYENCIWDGYYHYPKPDNFHHVCDLINATVVMGYVTFGLVTIAWAFVSFLAVYILLYLDQEVLSELTNDMGGRAYRARTFARQSMRPPSVMPTNADGYPASEAAPGLHRRASSQASRRSPPQPYSEVDAPYSPRSQALAPEDLDNVPASRRIPNPDAAVPMSEKQALAQRYASGGSAGAEPHRPSPNGMTPYGYGHRRGPSDIEHASGPMMQ